MFRFISISILLVMFMIGNSFAESYVCTYFEQQYQNDSKSIISNGEAFLGYFLSDGDEPWAIPPKPFLRSNDLANRGFPLDDPTALEWFNWPYVVNFSEVDIDNDGVPELRMYITAGSARCIYSVFYKKESDGKYHRLQGEYEKLYEEGRHCGGKILFPRYKGVVYVLEAYGKIAHIWRGGPTGLTTICDT